MCRLPQRQSPRGTRGAPLGLAFAEGPSGLQSEPLLLCPPMWPGRVPGGQSTRAQAELPRGRRPSWLERPLPPGLTSAPEKTLLPASKSSAAESRTSRRPQLRATDPPPRREEEGVLEQGSQGGSRGLPGSEWSPGPMPSKRASPPVLWALCPHCSAPCCHGSLYPCAGLKSVPQEISIHVCEGQFYVST